MKKLLKGTSVILATAMAGAVLIESGVATTVAHADSTENVSNSGSQVKSYPKFVSQDKADEIINDYLSTANDQQLEAIQQKVASSVRTTVNGDETTVSIDDDVAQTAIMSVIAPNTSVFQERAKSGTTKLVWHGAAKKGNVDVYISAWMLNEAKQQGFNVLAQICLLPLGAIGGTIGRLVQQGLKSVLGHVFTGVQKKFKYGRIFHFRGGKYKSWSYQ
ncbi:hypothetical protein [Levilactobacillus spicheri]|uniref:Uncharacterized protein n=2 Tax=Levilactobacillus spicheri TaxID=216463 RepID=A0ABQ0WMI6_9LACO|nr:hypothetical protein [Levilactobacillus spicheri]KRL46345.1 hypothetical protein FD37_GL000570 [Levilactobacillus spicheri DSM 15429]GEO66228.1 hypothetical protein LSP04_06470 [Levilactobacillus spicheri]